LRGPVEGLRLLSVTCGRTPACECQTTDRYFLETWFIGRKCAASGTRPCKPGPARPIPVHLSMGALPESPFLASVPSGWRDRLFFSPRIQMAHPFLSGSTSRRTSCLRVADDSVGPRQPDPRLGRDAAGKKGRRRGVRGCARWRSGIGFIRICEKL